MNLFGHVASQNIVELIMKLSDCDVDLTIIPIFMQRIDYATIRDGYSPLIVEKQVKLSWREKAFRNDNSHDYIVTSGDSMYFILRWKMRTPLA